MNTPHKIQNRKLGRLRSMIVVALLFFLFNSAFVTGLGVSPASKTIYFQPNSTVELMFDIINSEQNAFEASLSAIGDLKEIIFFESQVVKVNSTAYRTPFKTIIRFPIDIEPGIHTANIKITPSLTGLDSNMFSAYVSPQIPISIKVPYPFKYADISLVVLNVDEGTPVPIFVEFDNMGASDILRAGAWVEIYSPENKFLANLTASEISIPKNGFSKTQAQPAPILRKGLYQAIVNAHYDEVDKVIKTNFTLGDPLIRIRELITKKLVRDEINKVIFKVYSEWNTELSATGFLRIEGVQQELLAFSVDKSQEKEITGFFDTTDLSLGQYNLNITLIYANQIRTESYPISIVEKGIQPEKLVSRPVIIMLIVLAAIILAIAIILIIRKKRKPLNT